MATAKKLPSGNWRVRVFSHTDANGKKVIESFTAPTKREAELMAAEWVNKNDRKKRSQLTVHEAIEGYINAKKNVLSPATIRGYDKMYRNNYKSIEKKYIKKITTEELQLFVSEISKDFSAKSVANIYGLLSSALTFYMPDTVFRVSLPHRAKKRTDSPSNEDIQLLFKTASRELKKCIALSAFGSLRRGEISALTYSDLKDGIITVDKDMVEDMDNNWYIKEFPKSDASIRYTPIPDKVVQLLGTGKANEKIVKYASPSSISGCFVKLRDRLGVNVRFHDLRHYYASIGAVLGIPDNYLADFGGWTRGGSVMKAVYQNTMKSAADEYSKKMNSFFDDLI